MVGCSLGVSRLWFTIGGGIVNEVYYPRIDIPQIRDLGFLVADSQGFWEPRQAGNRSRASHSRYESKHAFHLGRFDAKRATYRSNVLRNTNPRKMRAIAAMIS
jgi:GH15 family glucan-1,4-alpha-glucosidase